MPIIINPLRYIKWINAENILEIKKEKKMSSNIILTQINSPKQYYFNQMGMGQHFIYEDEVYLRIFKVTIEVKDNAISVNTGVLATFDLDTVVEPISIEEIRYSKQ